MDVQWSVPQRHLCALCFQCGQDLRQCSEHLAQDGPGPLSRNFILGGR